MYFLPALVMRGASLIVKMAAVSSFFMISPRFRFTGFVNAAAASAAPGGFVELILLINDLIACLTG